VYFWIDPAILVFKNLLSSRCSNFENGVGLMRGVSVPSVKSKFTEENSVKEVNRQRMWAQYLNE